MILHHNALECQCCEFLGTYYGAYMYICTEHVPDLQEPPYAGDEGSMLYIASETGNVWLRAEPYLVDERSQLGLREAKQRAAELGWLVPITRVRVPSEPHTGDGDALERLK